MDDKAKSPFVSNKEIQRIAEELGVTVKFNSPNPGIYNESTGEYTSYVDFWDNWMKDWGLEYIENEN